MTPCNNPHRSVRMFAAKLRTTRTRLAGVDAPRKLFTAAGMRPDDAGAKTDDPAACADLMREYRRDVGLLLDVALNKLENRKPAATEDELRSLKEKLQGQYPVIDHRMDGMIARAGPGARGFEIAPF
jgi:hypothetical protein